jgi:hypothetical protein
MTPPDGSGRPWREQFVTNEQLDKRFDEIDKKIDRLPTVKHVQFLVLSAVVASQVLPNLDGIHSALPAVRGSLQAIGLLP